MYDELIKDKVPITIDYHDKSHIVKQHIRKTTPNAFFTHRKQQPVHHLLQQQEEHKNGMDQSLRRENTETKNKKTLAKQQQKQQNSKLTPSQMRNQTRHQIKNPTNDDKILPHKQSQAQEHYHP
jgi:hypothetical protein